MKEREATKVAFRTKSGEKFSLQQRSRPRCLFDSHSVPRGAALDRLICAG